MILSPHRWMLLAPFLLTMCTTEQSDPVDEPDRPYDASEPLAVGPTPADVELADFDGDGHLDLLVANHDGDSILRFAGHGDGHFTQVQEIASGAGPRAMAVGDLNGDGMLDAAVANSDDNTVTVLANQGDGSLAASSVTAGARPRHIVAHDFNHDSFDELLVADADDDTVSLFVSDGAGGFERTAFSTGTQPVHAVVTDLDEDGHADVITANRSTPPRVSVLLGDGAGGFAEATSHNASNRPGLVFPIAPIAVTAGDINGDGHTDVVVGNRGLDVLDGEVWLLAGDGTGNLDSPVEIPGVTVLAPAFVELVDLNQDGDLDMVEADHDPMLATMVASLAGSGFSVCLAHGDGGGAFEHSTCLTTGDYPYDVAVGDMNGDGRVDLATADSGSNRVSIFLASW